VAPALFAVASLASPALFAAAATEESRERRRRDLARGAELTNYRLPNRGTRNRSRGLPNGFVSGPRILSHAGCAHQVSAGIPAGIGAAKRSSAVNPT
jgi:hypothetical protein